jgi:hypothetical protein
MGWGSWLRHMASLLVEFTIRRRSAGSHLLKAGAGIFGFGVIGGWAVSFVSPNLGIQVYSLDAPDVFQWVGLALGVPLMLVGAALLCIDWRREAAEKQRKKVIVIEHRGLATRNTTPLSEAVPKHLVGIRDPVIVDHADCMRNGRLTEVAHAFAEARDAGRDIARRRGDTSPQDITVVYGGMSPVPLTFLVGTHIGAKDRVVLMDWDRFQHRWRTLDEDDDGDRLVIPDLTTIPRDASAVGLAISISYQVDEAGAQAALGDMPIISVRVSSVGIGNHWSEEKQQALGSAFANLLASLGGMGVDEIHLFLAAPNSVVCRFGTLYDNRNMPRLFVYQYERSDSPPFPWSISMAAHGEDQPGFSPVLVTGHS